MIDKQQIDELREKKGIPKMEFYEKIGMTSKGYVQMFDNNSMKISTLEKIAEILNVPVAHFFSQKATKEPSVTELRNKIDDLYEENRSLMKENNALKDSIRTLEKNSNLPEDVAIPKLKEKK